MSNQGIPEEIELTCTKSNKFQKKLLLEAKKNKANLILVSNQKKPFQVHASIITKSMRVVKEKLDSIGIHQEQKLAIDLDSDMLDQMIQFVYGEKNFIINPKNAHKFLTAFETLGLDKFASTLKQWYQLLMEERKQMHAQANEILQNCIAKENKRVAACLRIANQNQKVGFVAFQASKACRWVSVEKKYDQLQENQGLFVLLDESGKMVYHNIYDYDPESFLVKTSTTEIYKPESNCSSCKDEDCVESCKDEDCVESCKDEDCVESCKLSCKDDTCVEVCKYET